MDAAHEFQLLSHSDQAYRQHYIKQLANNGTAAEHSLSADGDVSTANALCRQAHTKHGKDGLAGAISLGQSICNAA